MMPLTAPPAPGAMGQAIEAPHLLRYLTLMDEWIGGRRRELDELDAAACSRGTDASLTRDITLAMATWQAVRTRYQLLLSTWDSGRVTETDRLAMAGLIWGRVDGGTAGGDDVASLNVSLPEACRLNDALTASLRSRLQLSPDAGEMTARLRGVAAQLERLRDQVALEPEHQRARAESHVARLAQRHRDLSARAARGGDIGGMIGPLEHEANTLERDLIVGGAKRRRAAAKASSLHERLTALQSHETAVQALVDRAVATVAPAPRLGVPHVANLGAIPSDTEAQADFEALLDRVETALGVVSARYGEALAEADDLAERLEAVTGAEEHLHRLAADALAERPIRMPVARGLVATAVGSAVKEDV